MIVITGAAGFIGSNLLKKLNDENFRDIILVDDFSHPEKNKNIDGKVFTEKIDRKEFIQWLDTAHQFVQFIFHIGARTDTAEFDKKVFDELNVNYSQNLWNQCLAYGIPIVYASSAATYGMGEYGYNDNHSLIPKLKPLNPYGESKQQFDLWALNKSPKPVFWAGLKFFNVYGPNEYHKGRMASVVYHAYNQIKETGAMKLFRSHHPDFEDGKQMRDFVYVKDVVDVLYYLMHNRKNTGIYNLGTGKARTFKDLVRSVFKALDMPENISFIDTPEDIRDKYQYFTEAEMDKLRKAGYEEPFTSLEKGVDDYVKNYLVPNAYH